MKKAILIAGIFIALYGCKKEITVEPKEELKGNQKSDYLPMAVGNYWIYQMVDIDSAGHESSYFTDSVVVEKDTVIRGRTYYLFATYTYHNDEEKALTKTVYYSDSSKNLVTSEGFTHFSENNFTDTLYRTIENPLNPKDTLAYISYKMEKPANSVALPAGSFNNLLDFKGTLTYNEKYYPYKSMRYLHYYYTKGVGRILNTSFYLSDLYCKVEYRLIRYHIIQ